jgi:hypothetical protein
MGLPDRLLRILRHGWRDASDVRRVLDKAALARLQAAVTASEQHHSGEIRLCIEAGLPLSWLWRDAPVRQRVLGLFGELGVWNTADNNGVLIYLLLADRVIEIVADRGLAQHVPQAQWDALVAGMQTSFRDGRFEAGLQQVIAAVDGLLREHYALAPGQANPNELPDAADLR